MLCVSVLFFWRQWILLLKSIKPKNENFKKFFIKILKWTKKMSKFPFLKEKFENALFKTCLRPLCSQMDEMMLKKL